jgi:hypothetical protein
LANPDVMANMMSLRSMGMGCSWKVLRCSLAVPDAAHWQSLSCGAVSFALRRCNLSLAARWITLAG